MNRQVIVGVLSLMIAGIAGCAGYKQFKSGAALLEQGHCDQAVDKLVAAVELSQPAGKTKSARLLAQEYRQEGRLTGSRSLDEKIRLLNRALECAAENSLAAAERADQEGQLEKGRSLLHDALAWIPQQARAVDLLKKVEQKMARAGELLAEAQTLGQQNQWEAALAKAEEACQLNRTLIGGEEALQRIRKGGYDWYYQAAQGALDKDDRNGALAQLAKAREFIGQAAGSDVIETMVANRNKADERYAVAEQQYAAGDFQQALAGFLEVRQLFEQRPGIGEAIGRAQDKLCESYLATTRAKMAEKDYLAALQTVGRCRELQADYAGAAELEGRIRGELYQENMGRAGDFLARNLAGNAWLYGVLALGYQPDNDGRELVSRAAQQIKQRIQFSIGVNSLSERGSMAGQIEDCILSTLQQHSPAQAEIAGLTPAGGRNDVVVEWRLLNHQVTNDETVRYETTQFNRGRVRVHNPDYHQMDVNLRLAQMEYNEACNQYRYARDRRDRERQDMDRMTPEEKKEYMRQHDYMKKSRVEDLQDVMESRRWHYERMRSDFVHMSPWREVDDIGVWQYPVYRQTRRAEIEISMNIMDRRSGQILGAGRLRGVEQAQDDYCTGDAFHNVGEDRLNLPDEAQLERAAFEQVARQIEAMAAKAAGHYGDYYYDHMRQARQEGNQEQAVEEGVNFWFMYGDGRSGEAVKLLDEVAGRQAEQNDWKMTARQYQ